MRAAALLVVAALLAACGPAPVDAPDAPAIYAAAFDADGLPDDARALLFATTVRGGLEHLAIGAGHDPDAPVDTMRADVAARLADEGLEVGAELDALLAASQRAPRRLPPLDVPGLEFVRIDEDDYRDRIATTRDCERIFAELGLDDDATNAGLWFASPIGLDADRRRALVYVGRGEVGELVGLQRDGAAWTVTRRLVLWRSS